ncbi:MAG: GTPase, partial [Actinomycetota bacterium]
MSAAGDGVAQVTAALDEALELGSGRLPDDDLAALTALRARVEERLARGDGLAVVAVAGGTGVGKSALVNRLARAPVVDEGVRRPTTAHPIAVAAAFDDATDALCDWLAVDDRRTGAALPAGLVLVDLPDHDSVERDHERTARRLAERVDALVVVVDPLKYARADLHDGLLAELGHHAALVTVALNRSDELTPEGAEACRADLRARLAASGLGEAELRTTSAATGQGVAELGAGLAALAASREAAATRLVADAAGLAGHLADHLARLPVATLDAEVLLAPLLEATDAHRAAADAERAYRREARAALRSPLARLVRAPATLAAYVARGLGLAAKSSGRQPRASGSRLRVERATRAALAEALPLAASVGADHASLRAELDERAGQAAPRLAAIVAEAPRRPSPRRWWAALALLRGLAEGSALIGLGWLVARSVVDWLDLPALPTPTLIGGLTWPSALLLGGLAARLALGLASRLLARAGAARHRRAVERAVRDRLAGTLEERV